MTRVGQGGALTAQTGGQAGHVEDQINPSHSPSSPPLLLALSCLLITEEAGGQVSLGNLHLTTGGPGGTTSVSRAASASPDPGSLTLPVWREGEVSQWLFSKTCLEQLCPPSSSLSVFRYKYPHYNFTLIKIKHSNLQNSKASCKAWRTFLASAAFRSRSVRIGR